MKQLGKRLEWAALLALVVAAAFFRLYRLDEVPPGWRDDELINSLVISQHVLDGEWAVFYPDASGHEALYHVLNAGMLALFGPGVPGIRWLSAALGVISVVLTYTLGRELFAPRVGLIAAAGLTFSFWSLMYSRIGLRHISLLPFLLGAILLWWRGMRSQRANRSPFLCREFWVSGILLGLGYYTYFASRGVPAVFLATAVYWLLFDRVAFRRRGWRTVAVVLISALFAVPLLIALARLPEMTGRVEELAVPLVEARQGNWEPLYHHVTTTMSMFHADGDGEWLYNIPNRPVFNPLGAILFGAGLAISLFRAMPLSKSRRRDESVFLLLWLGAGLVPGFLSVPPASLGHTIIAQPVAYLIPAVALSSLAEWLQRRWGRKVATYVAIVIVALFLGSNAVRDLDDYFARWPERGMVRLLYRADIRDAAVYLSEHLTSTDLAIGGTLAGPWDQQALHTDMSRPVSDRWFDPSRALVFPAGGGDLILTTFPDMARELESELEQESVPVAEADAFRLFDVHPASSSAQAIEGFTNGLTLMAVTPTQSGCVLHWWVESPPLGIFPRLLISNPPPPGVDTRLRLSVFVHLLDENGGFLAGDDGLWVDPYSLRTGDRWVQLHRFDEPVWNYDLAIGLYDPVTGERFLTEDGRDHLVLRLSHP